MNVVSIIVRQYEFLFDLTQERVVAVCGLSWKDKSPRDTQYMAEFLGAVTSERKVRALVSGLTAQHATRRLESLAKSWKDRFFEEFGTDYDRGHFISLRQRRGLRHQPLSSTYGREPGARRVAGLPQHGNRMREPTGHVLLLAPDLFRSHLGAIGAGVRRGPCAGAHNAATIPEPSVTLSFEIVTRDTPPSD